MKSKAFCVPVLLAMVLGFAAPWSCAQDGLTGALKRAVRSSPGNFGAPVGHTLATADFDGDNQPDGALLIDDGWFGRSSIRKIEVHFTGRDNTDLTFQSNESSLAISALDVNGDGATDIVVEQPFTHKRLKVWINDGRGGFRSIRNEDFSSTEISNPQRLGAPFQRAASPALCLQSRGNFEIAIITASPLLHGSSAARKEASPFGTPPPSRELAPGPPRAPPILAYL